MRYRPLDADKNEIRLLEYLPTKDEDFLHFRLRHFPLDKAPQFWAFSYTWGDPEKKDEIILDGHNFDITENLGTALRQFLYLAHLMRKRNAIEYKTRYLWVDAVCINQNDSRERAQQVLRMQHIYRASLVCVPFNMEFETSLRTFQTTVAFAKAHQEGGKVAITSGMWQDLWELFSQPWFSRVWVIQEFVMARLPVFLLGCFPAQPMHLFLTGSATSKETIVELSVPQRASLWRGNKQWITLLEATFLIHEFNHEDILTTLLWGFRDRLATDPKDKIYSLLGMVEYANARLSRTPPAPPATRHLLDTSQIRIDYRPETSLEDVYASVVLSVVSQTSSLNIICACQGPTTFERSWVPDWSQPWCTLSLLNNSFITDLGGGNDSELLPRYHASGICEVKPVFPNNGLWLRAQGLICCEIRCLADLSSKCPEETPCDFFAKFYQDLDVNLKAWAEYRYKKACWGGLRDDRGENEDFEQDEHVTSI